jgi:hypothetical protein
MVEQRLQEQLPIFEALQRGDIGLRVGQALEIAIYRALLDQSNLEYLGAFLDLGNHDDSSLYKKEEHPSSLSGKTLPGKQKLDFLVYHSTAGWAGIESKNVREWLYPDRTEILELLGKCITLDCVPVLIARRIPFVTFRVLGQCGVVFHQTYNQLLPESESTLAIQAKDKNLLGYHDIRIGNKPDQRLKKFIGQNLPQVLPHAKVRFQEYKDLLKAYANRSIPYKEFAARVRRRGQGVSEDSDLELPDEY